MCFIFPFVRLQAIGAGYAPTGNNAAPFNPLLVISTIGMLPSSKFTVFSHQFSSIAGAGPVTGPILASVFGWVPVLLWLIIGGLFFGAVQDFGALYASVKNEGKSMGMIIEKYIGKTGRKLFMLFCWLFTLLVIAAFTDMVAGTFVGTGGIDR